MTTQRLLVSFVLLAAATAASAQTAQDLLPNQDGNAWTYEVSGRIGAGTQHDLAVTGRSGGWARFEGTTGLPGMQAGWFWLSGQSGRIWRWDSGQGTYHQAYHLGVGQGGSFTAVMPSDACFDGTEWQVVDTAASVQTAVGTFNDCLVVANTRSVCADAGISSIAFAPGVGIVEYTWTTIAGGHSARLVHAVVDGREYKPQPAAGGVTVSLTIDKAVYRVVEDREPPVPTGGRPLVPETLTATLSIKNDTRGNLEFHYTSGQSYDFHIKDDRGNTVYVWSANKLFTMALRRRTLLPSEELSYTDAFPLRVTGGGAALIEGRYTLEAIHSGGPERAVAGFEIQRVIAR